MVLVDRDAVEALFLHVDPGIEVIRVGVDSDLGIEVRAAQARHLAVDPEESTLLP